MSGALIDLRSDNTAPAHPAVMAALAEANRGAAGAYGDDQWTRRAGDWFRDQFGGDTEAFLVWNGTGANVTALRAITPAGQGVITSDQAHIHVDECGAPEWIAGVKLIPLASRDAKLTGGQVAAAAEAGVGFEHHIQPRALSLTQTTEYGTAYSLDELATVIDIAHRHGVRVHVDGARIANAAATLGCSLRALSRDVGVDVLSFGLTKNGALGAEAVVIFDPAVAAEVKYLRKQDAQLASKMRYLAAQVLALAEGDLWLENAGHANRMARRLAEGLAAVGATITQRVEANGIFALLDSALRQRLEAVARFYTWNEQSGEVRLMTTWATSEDEVARVLDAARPPD